MAGNLPVPQGMEVKLVWGKAGIPFALNILHFTHGVGQIHNQTRADSIDSIYKTALTSSGHGGALATSVSLIRVESRHMDSLSDPWFIGTNASVAGTGTGDALPPATSIVVTTKTGLRGRSYNGRVYLTGFVEAVNDAAGQILQANATNAVNFLSTAGSNMNTTLQLIAGVLSRWTTPPTAPPGTPPTERNPPVITGITSYTMLDLRWDVQRRRAIPGI